MSAGQPVRLGVVGCGWIARCRLRQLASALTAERGRSRCRQQAAGVPSAALLRGRRAGDDSENASEHGGSSCIEELAPPVTVAALLDVDTAALDEAAALAPSARVVRSLGDIDRDLVDAVMISTPSALHGRQTLELLKRGLPVFVQKPLALTAQEVTRILTVAAERDLPVDTDFCYRHLRSATVLRHELRRGTIGTPFGVEACFHNAYRPGAGWAYDAALAGGGALMDLGIHLLDLVGWLTDEGACLMDARLLRRGASVGWGEVEDFATLDLQLRSGARTRLTVSWDASTGHDAQIELRIYGESGCLQLCNRGGSFFDFDAWHFQGTRAEHLAADDGDQWQAGPLRAWLDRVAAGTGYRHLSGAITTMSLVDQAYRLGRAAESLPDAVTGRSSEVRNEREF